ncbi:hypothetical protein L202_04911 [Cryptococcus amylolentus CBS 6039]|uniref:Uncharacterized protein n=1 Tax=Cryptococcus amylolentus CBS 6039 TaxID=1295533 RepID=A0A1E3HN86_9TREE|nr:hypothetical protein L202_04911 [Cryptococcus amylolentus CBS 6039]ODN77784.1 hypothetical protein L202_04911 [Cryptococcus amylolentus CBS 6039]
MSESHGAASLRVSHPIHVDRTYENISGREGDDVLAGLTSFNYCPSDSDICPSRPLYAISMTPYLFSDGPLDGEDLIHATCGHRISCVECNESMVALNPLFDGAEADRVIGLWQSMKRASRVRNEEIIASSRATVESIGQTTIPSHVFVTIPVPQEQLPVSWVDQNNPSSFFETTVELAEWRQDHQGNSNLCRVERLSHLFPVLVPLGEVGADDAQEDQQLWDRLQEMEPAQAPSFYPTAGHWVPDHDIGHIWTTGTPAAAAERDSTWAQGPLTSADELTVAFGSLSTHEEHDSLAPAIPGNSRPPPTQYMPPDEEEQPSADVTFTHGATGAAGSAASGLIRGGVRDSVARREALIEREGTFGPYGPDEVQSWTFASPGTTERDDRSSRRRKLRLWLRKKKPKAADV